MTSVRTNVVTAVKITDYKSNDHLQFIPLVEATTKNFELRDATAEKAYSGRTNLRAVEELGGTAFVRVVLSIHASQAFMS